MNRILKWLGIGFGVLLALLVAGGAGVYVMSQRVIERRYEVPLGPAVVVPSDAASIAKGERLAAVYGCNNSCHGKQMQGARLYDEPGIATINAPNLTRVLREYTDAELERLIRRGVTREGRSTWIMPSPMFAPLTDEDLGAIIAFVRSVPLNDGPMRHVSLGPIVRIGLVTGKFKPLAAQITARLPRAATTDRSNAVAFGEYLVRTSCTECHGRDLEGSDFLKAPGLLVMAGYSDEAFTTLMRTGLGVGGRKLGLMTEAAETRFARMTDGEVEAIRRYLRARYPVPAEITNLAAACPQPSSATTTTTPDAASCASASTPESGTPTRTSPPRFSSR